MAGAPKKKLRKTKFEEFKAQPNAMDLICARIVSAGTLVHVCREFDIHYPSVHAWIEDDPDRKARFETATKGRESHVKELVLRELIDLLHVNPRDAYRADGSLKPLHDVFDKDGNLIEYGMPETVSRYIASLDVEESTTSIDETKTITNRIKKLKLYDRMDAVKTLAKYARMLIEKHEIDAGKGWAEIVERSITSNENSN